MKKFFTLFVALCAICTMSANTFALYVKGTDAPKADAVQAQADGVLTNKTIATPVGDIVNDHRNKDAECQVKEGCFRWPATDTMIVNVAKGVTITKIEFVRASGSKGAFSSKKGSVTGNGTSANCVWTGSVTDQLILRADKQVRFSAMIVTYSGEGVVVDPDTTSTDTTNVDPAGTIDVTGLALADAYYYTNTAGQAMWGVDLYVSWDETKNEYVYPEMYVIFPATSKTSLKGTYECIYGCYWSSANDSIEADSSTISFDYVSDDGDSTYNYNVVVTLNTSAGKYVARATVNIMAYDEDSEDEDVIVMNEENGTIGGTIRVDGLKYGMAYYYEEEGEKYWDIDLFAGVTSSYNYIYPETYVVFPATSRTSIAGTHECIYGGYWSSDNDSIESLSSSIKLEYLGDNGDTTYNYKAEVTINIDDATFIISGTVTIEPYDYDEYEYIVLKENGGSDPVVTPTGSITCAEAKAMAAKLSENEQGPEVTVVGYVTSTINEYDKNKGKQSFWMADKADGGKVFEAYWGVVSRAVKVGEMVSVTGKLQSYKGTPEIPDGKVEFLSGTGVEEVSNAAETVKFLRNGQLLIRKEGKTYNVLGTVVE